MIGYKCLELLGGNGAYRGEYSWCSSSTIGRRKVWHEQDVQLKCTISVSWQYLAEIVGGTEARLGHRIRPLRWAEGRLVGF